MFEKRVVIKNSPGESQSVSWLLAGLWSLAIFGLVPLAPSLQKLASERWGRLIFAYATLAVLATLATAAVRYLVRHRHGTPASYIWLAVVGLVFLGYTIYLRQTPVEAVHLALYAVLGGLCFRALSHRIHDWTIYITASIIASIVGMVDEILQWLTPGRYWGLHDIWIDFLGAALMQVAIAKGLRPEIIGGPVRPASIRVLCRFTKLLLLALGVTLLNTPQRIAWYSRLLPALNYLETNESVMFEYGQRFSDPETGPFRSRLSPRQLRRTDAERGAEAARILDRFRDPKGYRRFLKKYTPVVDPFVHEARVHLFRRDRHLLWARDPKRDARQHRVHLTVAFRENRIMEKYFPTVLGNSSYLLPDRQIARLKDSLLPDDELPAREVESTVSRDLVTAISERQVVSGLLLAILALALIDRRHGPIAPREPRRSGSSQAP